MSKILIQNIIKQLQDIIDGDLWIDENFVKKIEKLSSAQALTKPLIQDVFSVAELVSHITAWRTQLMKRLSELTPDSNYPDYWRSNEELKKIKWVNIKNEFFKTQNELIELLKKKDDTFLKKKIPNSEYTLQYLIEGLIHHDIYHLGQIGVTVKLLNRVKKKK